VRISDIPFVLTDWAQVERTEHKGEAGTAYWRTRNFGEIRVRMVEYTAGYLADHWCSKGHVVLCLEGTARYRVEGRPKIHPHAGHELSGCR
jgi:hypothetical protein